MKKKVKIRFNHLIELIDKYKEDAELCLKSGAYFAGLVAIRAALETMLLARFLVGLYDWEKEELEKHRIKIEEDFIEIPDLYNLKLKTLIQAAYNLGLLKKSGYEAAERIRKWGNKIHCTNVAVGKRFPPVGERNLKARLKDLEIVANQLLKSL